MALCLAEARVEVGQGAARRACVLERGEMGGLGSGLGMEGGCGCDAGGVGSWWGVGGAQVGGSLSRAWGSLDRSAVSQAAGAARHGTPRRHCDNRLARRTGRTC